MPSVTPDLIFDVGLHKGLDAQFYLKKGFSVVGLEASPELCAAVRAASAGYLVSGQLTIIEKALAPHDHQVVEFFINADKDDWGSLYRDGAERDVGQTIHIIQVPTITLETMLRDHGVPYYLKCDIEGADQILAEQLLRTASRPTFVSIEVNSADDIARLLSCGYDTFQLINQYMLPFVKCPNPAREGRYVDTQFTHETSGLFGRELPAGKWTGFSQVISMYLDWRSLRGRDADLAIGWLDVHACHASALA